MKFIDTHTHFVDEAFMGEGDTVINRAVETGVEKMIHPDIDSNEREAMFNLVDKYQGVLYPMLGLYPESVNSEWQKEIDLMLQYKDRKIVAIGEIGLDYHTSKDFAKEQMEALRWLFELAAKMNLPVNIHLRDATDDFFKVLEDCKHLGLRGNMHAFSGSYETFMRLQKYGDWYVGIGGIVTFKKASIAEDIKQIPLSHIVLETDSPYLTPVPHRGTRNESSYIPFVAQKIADQKGIDIEEVADATTQNAIKLFNL